jgi:glutamine synthetase
MMPGGGVGNGVHIHFSLRGEDGTNQSFDPDQPNNISTPFGQFIAGVLANMADFMPLTAASSISYERLQPNRWSASCNNLGQQSREAGVRICPIRKDNPAQSFNVEFRAADATSNPYLALGALVWAGLDGLRNKMPLPAATEGDINDEDMEQRGLKRLPATLAEALERFRNSNNLKQWMGEEFHHAYLLNKRSELKLVDELDIEEQIQRYARCY